MSQQWDSIERHGCARISLSGMLIALNLLLLRLTVRALSRNRKKFRSDIHVRVMLTDLVEISRSVKHDSQPYQVTVRVNNFSLWFNEQQHEAFSAKLTAIGIIDLLDECEKCWHTMNEKKIQSFRLNLSSPSKTPPLCLSVRPLNIWLSLICFSQFNVATQCITRKFF